MDEHKYASWEDGETFKKVKNILQKDLEFLDENVRIHDEQITKNTDNIYDHNSRLSTLETDYDSLTHGLIIDNLKDITQYWGEVQNNAELGARYALEHPSEMKKLDDKITLLKNELWASEEGEAPSRIDELEQRVTDLEESSPITPGVVTSDVKIISISKLETDWNVDGNKYSISLIPSELHYPQFSNLQVLDGDKFNFDGENIYSQIPIDIELQVILYND